MLTIVLLLCCFKSWCQNKVSELSFTGEIQLAPDSTCIVPIKLIKQANIKLIERNSFTKVMQEQEDIIKLQKLELKEYSVNDPYSGQTVTGGIITITDSNWLMSFTCNRQPHFPTQPDDILVLWVYALFMDKEGC